MEEQVLNKMNMLIFGNCTSIFTRDYIEYVLDDSQDNIFIIQETEISEEIARFYDEHNVCRIKTFDENGAFSQIKKCRTILKAIKDKMHKKVDKFVVHCVPYGKSIYLPIWIAKHYSKKTALVFWGSDVLRLPEKYAPRVKRLCKQAYKINVVAENMIGRFRKLFGNEFDEKIMMCGFGTSIFDNIKECKLSVQEAKVHFGVPVEKSLINIGYSGNEAHQHLAVIKQISKLDTDVKNKIFLQAHIGYGLQSQEYKKKIIEAFQKSGCEYNIIEQYLDKHEISKLRIATDIFIHAQITDAHAATIREYIYAKTTVLNPAWIQYKEFQDIGLQYIEYSKFEELPEILTDIINDGSDINYIQNQKNVYEHYSWAAKIEKWKSLFE